MSDYIEFADARIAKAHVVSVGVHCGMYDHGAFSVRVRTVAGSSHTRLIGDKEQAQYEADTVAFSVWGPP